MKRIDFEHGTVTGNILGAALPTLIFHLAVLHPLDEDDGRTFLTAIADHIGSS